MSDVVKDLLKDLAKELYLVKCIIGAYTDAVGPDGDHVVEALLEGILDVQYIKEEASE